MSDPCPGTLHLHFDAFAGLSGDMILAALLDAGADADQLRHGLATLPLTESWELRVEQTTVNAFAATDVRVRVAGTEAEHLPAEPMPGVKGDHHQHHGHHHHDGHHHHGQGDGQGGTHTHRNLADCVAIIEGSGLSERVRYDARRVFEALAAAEARMHGTTPDRVHFHEVGATDAIIDIVGACLAVELLGVGTLSCSPLPTGRGFVRAAHGIIPIPAPATLELLRGRPVVPANVEGEMTTPTGAALAATLCTRWGTHPPMTLRAVGYGAGKKRWADRPNLLRVLLGEAEPVAEQDARHETVTVLEANLDDANPQLFDHVSARLFAAGARDVWLTPTLMKKGRPAVILSCLAYPPAADRLAEIIFAETPTLGIRAASHSRLALGREWEAVETRWGPVRLKWAVRDGTRLRATPEYEDCRALAERTGVPLQEILADAAAMARGSQPTAGVTP